MRGTGSEIFSKTDLAATATLVKAGAVSLSGYHIFNTTAAAAYVQFFDKATAAEVTVGTTAPTFALGLPASGGAVAQFQRPLQFTNGIVVASTTTATGNTAATTAVALMVGD